MKKLNFTLFFVLSFISSYAQNCNWGNGSQDSLYITSICYWGTALEGNNETISARDAVTLTAGFSFTNTTAHTLTFETDHTIVQQTPTYLNSSTNSSPIVIGTTRTLDKQNCIPGTIAGNVNIDPSGSTTYNIPISIAPGSHGMQPNIGIVYNSNSGNDILGYGWHLSGLSTITRVSRTPYYDTLTGVFYSEQGGCATVYAGCYAPITLSGSDVYALDGQRLIINSVATTANGVTTWSPENDPYTWVTLTYDYFTVTSKDGMVMTYGNSTVYNNNSKFIPSGATATLTWALDRITDSNGNYVQFNYLGSSSTGEYRIDNIQYTGNGSTQPFNTIEFLYEKRADVSTNYVAGASIAQTLLLTGIKVLSEGTLAQNYEFSYFYDGYYSKLNQISFSFDGKKYNPTIINWGTTTYTTTIKDQGGNFGSIHLNPILVFGDFNHDGYTDFIKFTTKITDVDICVPFTDYCFSFAYCSIYNVMGSSLGYYNLDSALAGPPHDINVMDWYNNGSDQVLNHIYAPLSGVMSDGIDDYYYSNNAIWGPNEELLWNPSTLWQYYYGYFAGDGKIERFLLEDSTIIGFANANENLPINGGVYGFPKIKHIACIKGLDFDGDGQSEFLILTSRGYGSIWKYKTNTQTFVNVYPGGNDSILLGKPQDVYIGDFNGDGKSDLLYFQNGVWNLSYSTGTGLIKGTAPPSNILQNYAPSLSTVAGQTASALYITDLNNDGKDDIVYCRNDSIYIIITSLTGFTLVNTLHYGSVSGNNSVINKIYINAINENGQKQLVYGLDGPSYHPNYQEIDFNSNLGNALQATFFTDGNNLNTQITYSNVLLQNNPVNKFPVFSITNANLPTGLIVTDLNASKVLTNNTYSYQNGYNHVLGKGFLGYQQFSITDNINGYVSTENFNFTINDGKGDTCYYTYPCSQTTSLYSANGIFQITAQKSFIRPEGGYPATRLFAPIMTSTTSNDLFKGNYSKTDSVINFDPTMGRVTDRITIASDGATTPDNNWTTETKNTYAALTGNQSILQNSLSISTLGTNSFTSSSSYVYAYSSPFIVTSKTTQGITTTYTYDNSYGNIIGTTISVSDGTPSQKTSCKYDTYGRFVISSTDVVGYTSTAGFRGEDGLPLIKTDPNGISSTYNYSMGGNSLVTQQTFPDGNVLTYTIAWDVSEVGLSTVTKSLTNGNTTTDYYSANGLKLKETSFGFNKMPITKTYTYNINNSVNTTTDNAGNITNYTYNCKDGSKRLSAITGLNKNLQYSYTKAPYSIIIRDNNLNQTKTETLDELNNLTSISCNGQNTLYSYFASGKLQSITNGTDGGVTSMTYDSLLLNQLTIKDPDAGTTKYKYNALGQIVSQVDTLTQNSTIIYDPYGRTQTITQKDINGNQNTTTYNYSISNGSLGKIQSITRDQVSQTYSYDGLGRVNSVTTSGGVTPTSGTATNFITTYTYNNQGQIASVSYPSGLTVNYAYDQVGNISQITNAAGGKIWTGNTVNSLNQWTNYSLGSTMTTNLGYDATYQLQSIQVGSSGNTQNILNLGFSFNPSGQLTQRSDNNAGVKEGFSYDYMDRLIQDSLIGSSSPNTHQTKYSLSGNITSTTWGGTYSYDVQKHPHSVVCVAGVSNSGQTGSPGDITNCTYNADNHILSIDNGNYHDNYTYGPNGDRFRVDESKGNTLSKVYVGCNEFGYNSSGGIVYKRTIIQAPTGVCAVYQDSGGVKSLFYVHKDFIGSWLAITDSASNVKSTNSYDAWGRPRNPSTWVLLPINVTNALVNFNTWQPRFDHGYTGHEQMAGFGLINANGRLYDAYSQRFLSPDVDIQDPSNVQNLNRYSYCLNNPFRYTDPTGNDYGDDNGGDDDGCGFDIYQNFTDNFWQSGNQMYNSFTFYSPGFSGNITTYDNGDYTSVSNTQIAYVTNGNITTAQVSTSTQYYWDSPNAAVYSSWSDNFHTTLSDNLQSLPDNIPPTTVTYSYVNVDLSNTDISTAINSVNSDHPLGTPLNTDNGTPADEMPANTGNFSSVTLTSNTSDGWFSWCATSAPDPWQQGMYDFCDKTAALNYTIIGGALSLPAEGAAAMTSLGLDELGTAGTAAEVADNAFVHVTTNSGARNILQNGLNPDISGFVTQWKYVKNVTNPEEFNTMLYKQSLWPQTAGKFDNGFTILKIDATPTFYSPRTNWVNGIPQYKFNSIIDPTLISKIP